MKKVSLIFCLLFVLTAFITLPFSASAWNDISGASDWEQLPGNPVDGTAKPSIVNLTSRGLEVTYTGGEYQPGGNNAGVMYKKPVNINGFSVTFTIDKKPGNYNLQNTGVDAWVSLCLLNKADKYFNVNNASQSQGIVILIRAMDGPKTYFDIRQLTNSWSTAPRMGLEHPGDMQSTYTVSFSKNADGAYDISINGQKVDLVEPFTKSFTTLMEKGSVYMYMGNSSRTANQSIKYTISKVNNTVIKSAGTASTVSSKTAVSNTVSNKASSAAVQTGTSAVSSSTASATVSSSEVSADTSSVAGTSDTESMADSSVGSNTEVNSTGTAKKSGVSVPIIIAIVVVVLAGGGAAVYFLIIKKR